MYVSTVPDVGATVIMLGTTMVFYGLKTTFIKPLK